MAAILAAGTGAGLINTVVGSGTLITFPTLLAVGYPPVLANVSNTVGLVLGSVSGAVGYRRELAGQARRLLTLGSASVLGGVTGGLLLLGLPSQAFRAIVPVLIVLAVVLVLLQPRLQRRQREVRHPHRMHRGLWMAVYGAGVYGGYFGAAQGVMLIAAMGAFLDEPLQRINAAKNVLAALVNGVAAVLFIVVTDVSWTAAGLIAAGSIVGGQAGAHIGRRLPPAALRVVIVVMGIVAIVALLT